MKKIAIIGAGRIGEAIAFDLKDEYKVTLVDRDVKRLDLLKGKYQLETLQGDALDPDFLRKSTGNLDLVVNTMPGNHGFKVLETLIDIGKDVVDISFFEEDPYLLSDKVDEKGLKVVFDCGVAPGLCNIILGYHISKEKVQSYKCYVGGLPFDRSSPFEYKAPFSPIDVIAEYTRPARIRIAGKNETEEALSGLEHLDFGEIGTLEAFYTDGLRSILHTTTIPYLSEKTLRYPGHAYAMQSLSRAGYFSSEIFPSKQEGVSALEMTSNLLFDSWLLEDSDDEFTIMRIHIETERSNYTYDVFDRRDRSSGLSSMARTTGFTCSSFCRLLLNGHIAMGLQAPEMIGQMDVVYKTVLDDLKKRGISIKQSITK